MTWRLRPVAGLELSVRLIGMGRTPGRRGRCGITAACRQVLGVCIQTLRLEKHAPQSPVARLRNCWNSEESFGRDLRQVSDARRRRRTRLMTLLARCVTANSRRSSADLRREASAANMESSGGEVAVDPADVVVDPAHSRRCLSTATPSPPRVSDATTGNEVDQLPAGNGSSFAPPDEQDPTPVSRSGPSSPLVVRDAKTPVLSFSVAAIMAKSTSPPMLRTLPQSQSVVELNHNDNHHCHRRRQDCPSSPVSPLAVSPRRPSAFTVDGILNGVGRTSSISVDDADDSSCSAADDSGSNRSSPGVARSLPPPPSTAAVSASSVARQNLPFLHPAGPGIDVACKWPPAGCPYPWQYVNPPSELLLLCLDVA